MPSQRSFQAMISKRLNSTPSSAPTSCGCFSSRPHSQLMVSAGLTENTREWPLTLVSHWPVRQAVEADRRFPRYGVAYFYSASSG
jgi:hypothetical protein